VIEEVGTITRTAVNRLTKKNALTTAMGGRLAAELRDANDDSNIGVVVLTGAERPFSAGNGIAPSRPLFRQTTVESI
jgi:enoyl-CoA hydratase/carnithine racemase